MQFSNNCIRCIITSDAVANKNSITQDDKNIYEINEPCSLNAGDEDVTQVTPMDVEPFVPDVEPTIKNTEFVSDVPVSTYENRVVAIAEEETKQNDVKFEDENKSKEDMFSFQKSFVILNPKRPKVLEELETSQSVENISKNISLVTKCEEFLESVKKSSVDVGSTGTVKKSKILTKDDKKILAAKEPCTKTVINEPSNRTTLNDIDIGMNFFNNFVITIGKKIIRKLYQSIHLFQTRSWIRKIKILRRTSPTCHS